MPQAIPIVAAEFQQPTVQPINPLDAAAKALGVAGAAQNLQAGNIAFREKQQQFKDEQDLRMAAQQANGDPDKITDYLRTSNPRMSAKWAGDLADYRKKMTDNAKDQLTMASSRLDLLGQVTQGIKDENSFQLGKQQLLTAMGPQAAAMLGDTYNPDTIKQFSDASLKHKDWLDAQNKAIDQALKAQQLELDKGKESREARVAWESSLGHAFLPTNSQEDFDNVKSNYQSVAPKYLLDLYGSAWTPNVPKKAAAALSPETQKVQADNFSMPQSRDEALRQLQSVYIGNLKDPGYQSYSQQLASMRYTPAGGAELIKQAQAETKSVREGVSRAAAELPTEVAKAKAIADLMTGGNDEEVAGVAPRDRDKARQQYLKAGQAFDGAQQARLRMDTVLDLARHGNKEAQASAALMGVQAINELAQVKRVNQAEIANYGNAGSLIDRVQGKLGKLAAGEPIPPDVLNDMQALHDSLANDSIPGYAQSVRTVNRAFHSKFDTTAPNTKKNPNR